jgi:O-antigen/teichoic acid export membrane protein
MADELVEVAEDSARGGFFLFSGTALATVILAVSSIIIGNLLGDILYGEYAVALSVAQLLLLFTDLGINQGIIKYAATLNRKGETGRVVRIVKYSLLLKVLVGMLLFAVNYVFAGSFAQLVQKPHLAYYIQIASISIPFHVIFSVAAAAFVGLDKTECNVIATNFQALAKTMISIPLVILGFSLAGAMWGYTASAIVGAVAGSFLLYLALRNKPQTAKADGLGEDVKSLMRYGIPLYITVLLAGLLLPYQTIVLARYATPGDIGNYKGAQNFVSLLTVLPIPITTALLPAFAKLDSSTTQKIKTFFKLANKYTTLLVIPITILLMTYSNEIVHIVYPSYPSAGLFLATYCILYFLVGIGYLTLSSLYNGLGDTRNTLIINLIGFIIVIILSPILTQVYSVQGMIAAAITAAAAGTIYGALKAKRKYGIEFSTSSILKIYMNAIISAIPPALLLYSRIIHALTNSTIPSFLLNRLPFLPDLMDVALGAALYVLIYLTLTPITRTITTSELEMVAHVTRKTKLLALAAKPFLKYEHMIIRLTTK